MKNIVIALSAIILIVANVSAQSAKFSEAMGKTLKEYGEAKTGDALLAVEAKFERIADAEKNQWLPYYYAALIKATMSMQGVGGDRDKVADEANELIEKAGALDKDNSEISVIKSMVQTAKMLIDPMARFMKNGTEANKFLEEAKNADATNPRPFMLQANNLKNTPPQYGGGCKTAKALAEKAVALYATFKSKTELHPNWGKESAEAIVAACK